jgi:hypothetical protein
VYPVCYVVAANDTASDDQFVRRATNLEVATRNHFARDLMSNTVNGQLLLDQWQIVAVGGRRSIIGGFAEQAARGITFSARNGQILYFTAGTSHATRTQAVRAGRQRAGQILTKPSMDTLNPAVNEKIYQTLALGLKERTVIRIFSAANGFAGHPLQPSCTGAYISLALRQHFQL